MFEKILIANRGEIAVRIATACRGLGVRSAAIYSEADAGALHASVADEAHPCGPPPVSESYLDMERVVEIARACGANAVHPGYGLLSENADFADLCRAKGLVFIGPSGDAIRAMGDKITARRSMQAAGVAIVPGTTESLSDDEAERWVERIGLPVMVKASAGGGGKGMRLVREGRKLHKAIARARSEAAASFGDDSVYLEKAIEEPRHIEIQILADDSGDIVHLFERECSIQRRHQKVIEEAPANRMTETLRAAMGAAAVAAARAVDYVGAGTVEFLVDAHDSFYFLEMNTRVQVEHPVTEMVTAVDIVQSQVRIAAGEPLGYSQGDLALRGHAIEARVYAEDPDKKFFPSPGNLEVYDEPEGEGIRVDSGVREGSTVSVYYDPLVAKLIAWGSDRTAAISRLSDALDAFRIEGIKTSIPFHRRVVRHPVFLAGCYDTSFIDAHMSGSGG